MFGYNPIRNSGDVWQDDLHATYANPPADLAPYIASFWDYSVPVSSVPIQVFPSGCCSLGFSLQGGHLKGYLYGPIQGSDAIGLFVEGVTYFGAAFHVYPYLDFVNVSVRELAGRRVDLSDVWPTHLAALMNENLGRSGDARREFLSKLLRQVLLPVNKNIDSCSSVVASLLASPSTRIHALAKAERVNERTLRRFFESRIGLSPKKFESTIRFQYTLKRILETDTPFCRLAAEMGYSDQSHLIRNFASFLGETPNRTREQISRTLREIKGLPLTPWNQY